MLVDLEFEVSRYIYRCPSILEVYIFKPNEKHVSKPIDYTLSERRKKLKQIVLCICVSFEAHV